MRKPANLTNRQWSKLLAYAEEVREANHRAQRVTVDDDGYSHIRGGAYGNEAREQYGYTKAEATTVRGLLRRDGVKVSLDEAEGHLACALVAIDGGAQYHVVMTGAERIAKYRETLPEGRCRSCPGATVDGKKYCPECNRKANERQRLARERKRAQAA